jgi:hypothetical protein
MTRPVTLVLLLALLAGALRAQPTVNDRGVVTLPPMMIEEKSAPLRWRYLAVPGQEILSVCDDRTSENFVERMLRLDELLREILPERFRAQLSVPEAHLLFNEETGRAHSREIIAEMVRKEGATVASDGTVVLPEPRTQSFLGGERRIKFLPNLRLNDLDAVRVFAILRDSADEPMEFTFARERIAFLLTRRAPALPEWLVEGLLEVYRHTRFRDREIEFEPLPWLSEEESAALARDPDRPRTLLPMEELFTTQRSAGGEDPSDLERIRRAQCALFLRWALSERKGQLRAGLWQWVERLETETPNDEGFRLCFGIGFSDARDRLSDYLPAAVSRTATLTAPRPAPLPRLKFRDATELEVARIRGDWERLQIPFVRKQFPALVESYVAQARRTLHRVYDRGERDPQLLAVLGLTECDAGNPAAGRIFLEEAARAKIVRPRVYLELARLRFRELRTDKGNAESRLTRDEVRSVVAPLLIACESPPPLLESYALMATVWSWSSASPAPADLAVLAEGARLFPSASALVMQVVHLHVVNGSFGPAASLADSGWRQARDPLARDRLARIRAELATAKH